MGPIIRRIFRGKSCLERASILSPPIFQTTCFFCTTTPGALYPPHFVHILFAELHRPPHARFGV